MTLISYESSGGETGRCDEKCYGAIHPQCTCICGGKNHGVGLRQAVDNTIELAKAHYGESGIEFDVIEKSASLKREVLGQGRLAF